MSLQIKSGDKLYVITRADLTFGQQASQLCHAMRQFTHEHPQMDKEWFENSNYICLLSVPNEEALSNLLNKAMQRNIACAHFNEPDLNNTLTAICLAPGAPSKKLVSNLKLAFSQQYTDTSVY